MTKEKLDKVREKIRKLLALGESPNEHEAGLAVSKARELMDQYNLEMSELGQQTETSGILSEAIMSSGRYDKWFILFLAALADFCDCKAYTRKNQRRAGKAFNVIGHREDIEIFKGLKNYLLNVIETELTRDLAEYAEDWKMQNPGRLNTKVFRNNYCSGMSSRIIHRLVEDRDQRLSENVDCRALVVRRKDEVDDWAKENLNLKTSRRKRGGRFDSDAYAMGAEAGNRADIHNRTKVEA